MSGFQETTHKFKHCILIPHNSAYTMSFRAITFPPKPPPLASTASGGRPVADWPLPRAAGPAGARRERPGAAARSWAASCGSSWPAAPRVGWSRASATPPPSPRPQWWWRCSRTASWTRRPGTSAWHRAPGLAVGTGVVNRQPSAVSTQQPALSVVQEVNSSEIDIAELAHQYHRKHVRSLVLSAYTKSKTVRWLLTTTPKITKQDGSWHRFNI